MAQSTRRYSLVGDYIKGKQIGEGSFSKVWHARHRVHGTEVAIKEIATARLNPKLQESLKSEIFILKRINHPNIIRLHDMIEEPGKIHIILEYCKGGDLSMYIQQRQGRIPEAIAKHFMLQLAEGLKVLRENSLIHRDLKPQNLLLSTKGDNSVLKIADFGFARSLHETRLAETLCGSPLYMAPEIMQLQKYDAKADLWSVGAILFQLLTGKTPFTGTNQIQLLQNIMKSTDLHFPSEAKDLSPDCIDLCKKLLRRNPVERLTFEEFFNHPYLSERQPDQSFRSRQLETVLDHFHPSDVNGEQSQDDLPFTLDDDTAGSDGSPTFPRKSSMKSMYGFSIGSTPDRRDLSNLANRTDSSKYGSRIPCQMEITGSSVDEHQLSGKNLKDSLKTTKRGGLNFLPKVLDSLESIDQDYVIVSGPPVDLSTSVNSFKPGHFPSKFGGRHDSGNINISSDQISLIGEPTTRVSCSTSPEDILSNPGISQGSMDIADTSVQPPIDSMAQISSLQWYAAAITELVNSKIEGGKQLEAFSVQLANLSIWKQALHICHTHAASAIEGSPSQETTRLMEVSKAQRDSDVRETLDIADKQERLGICSEIERAFLHEVGLAEELAKAIEPGNLEMPDAMELIYQSALDLGRRGAVDEYMGDIASAVVCYLKAVGLLQFLLVEAPSLILNPRFSLTNSDRYRIQNYINVLNNRQNISQSQRMAILKAGDQPFPS